MTIHAVTVLFGIDDRTDEHLRTVEAVKDEVRRWLEGLGADVQAVSVGSLPSTDGLSPQELSVHQYRFMRVMERGQQQQKGVLAAWLDRRPPEDKS